MNRFTNTKVTTHEKNKKYTYPIFEPHPLMGTHVKLSLKPQTLALYGGLLTQPSGSLVVSYMMPFQNSPVDARITVMSELPKVWKLACALRLSCNWTLANSCVHDGGEVARARACHVGIGQ